MRLKDKVAIITGAGSGIGRATAYRFAGQGAAVACVDMDPEGNARTVAAIEEKGGRAVAVTADVAVADQVENMVAETVKAFGRLDILFNNAGHQKRGTVVELAEEDWDRGIDVHLKGAFLGCKYAIPAMIETGGGSIINMSSLMGLMGYHLLAMYNAAKTGLIGLTRNVAVDFAKQGIRCNCVNPGFTDTEMTIAQHTPEIREPFLAITPMGRYGTTEEIANCVLFLAGDESSFVTGACLAVDGGASAR